MKKAILSVMLFAIASLANAQILRVSTTPSAIASQIPGYSQVSTINTKTYSYTPSVPPPPPTPVDEDSTTEDDKMYRYGDNIPVNITMPDGNITSTSIGKVWTIRISVPNALNIGVSFNQFNLSTTSEMYIFNEGRTVLDSAIKKVHFTNSNTVGIGSFKGNGIIIYIVEPNNFGTLQSVISIQNIIAGFQELDDVGTIGGTGLRVASIDCDPQVICQTSKMVYARAVARFYTNGHQCTGTLINNELNNGRAYFLTAFHCLDVNPTPFPLPKGNGVIDPEEVAALAFASFQFQFWRTQCNGSINNQFLEFSGATLKAAWKNSDVVLLELINAPGIGDLVNYAGWNRQTASPSNNLSFIIHHPDGQDMRITSTQNVRTWSWNNNYWTAHYYSGTVAPGSSGSALMNENGQIVGQLRSGWSSCNYTDFGDRYGKFDRSWSGANLQTWLSPAQNLQSTGLLNLTDIIINGPNLIGCTTPAQFSTLPNLLGVNYQWAVTGGLQIISGQGTSSVSISGIPNSSLPSGTITLTLTSPTKGRTRVYTTSKLVSINYGNTTGTYNSPTNNSQTLIPTSRFNPATNNTCLSVATNMSIPSGSTVVWSGPANTNEIIWGQSGNDVNIYFSGLNQTITLTITVTNSCGTQRLNYSFTCTSTDACGISPLLVVTSPNPSTSSMQVSLVEKGNETKKRDISEIRIIDRAGVIKQQNKYGNATKIVSLNISLLSADVYTIQVFDGHVWTTGRFIKN